MVDEQIKIITFKINDIDVSCREGETILDVAKENNIFIPTLCHLEGLTDIGACRLCLVEVTGMKKLLPACVTYPTEGMNVQTDTDKLKNYRRMILELLFSERNHTCAVCVVNGHCQLQSLAQRIGMDHVRIPYLYPKFKVDASHERYSLDHNRCILCTRCVRVCDEIEGAHTKDVQGRGITSFIMNDLNQPWGTSETCTSCGKCVHVCPTGALSEKGKSVAEMQKQRQFLTYLTTMRKKERV